MYLSLNELSFSDAGNNLEKPDAKKESWISFIVFLKRLKTQGLCEGLLVSGDVYSLTIGENYSLTDWLADPNVEKTYQQFMRTFLAKYCSYIDPSDINSEFLYMYGQEEKNGIGCAFAVEYDSPVLSHLTDECWNKKHLQGKYRFLNENGDLVEQMETVENWHSQRSEEELIKADRDRIYYEISSGQDLWEQREKLFPNLIFCESVKAQLYDDPERFHIIRVMERLQILQNYFATYDGRYDPLALGIGARTESETVKRSPELNRYRLFRKPDGEETFFFDHISFSGKYTDGRIHFQPSSKEKKCYIGYVGRHLPTKKF